MKIDLVGLALLMAAATYPSRALPILAPGIERLPPGALAYLRLVGPAVLAALAAVNVMIAVDPSGHSSFHVGIEWLAVALGIVLVRWRGNLFLGIGSAVALVALARWLGVG